MFNKVVPVKSLALACLSFSVSISAIAKETTPIQEHLVKPFIAEYSIIHKSDPVGKAFRELKYLDNNQVEYSYKTDISWLIFSDNRHEISTVELSDSTVTPVNYKFTREGTGRDKKYAWEFDVKNNKATNLEKNKTLDVDFPPNIQDKLSYHLQHRLSLIENPKQQHFVYPVISTSGKIKNYVYQYDGEEEIMLPYGLVKTVRLKREVTEKKRVTYVWFAPELNYLLVKLYQVKGGVEQFEAQLVSVEDTGN